MSRRVSVRVAALMNTEWWKSEIPLIGQPWQGRQGGETLKGRWPCVHVIHGHHDFISDSAPPSFHFCCHIYFSACPQIVDLGDRTFGVTVLAKPRFYWPEIE
jgi:hypothetical protein